MLDVDLILKGALAGAVTVIVLAIGEKMPRVGGLVVSLPIISIVVLTALWLDTGNLNAVSHLARETVIFVLLGLVLFVPLIFARTWGMGYWTALTVGIVAGLGVFAAYFRLAADSG